MTVLKRAGTLAKGNSFIILCRKNSDLRNFNLSSSTIEIIKKGMADDRRVIQAYENGQLIFALVKGEKESPAKIHEGIRKTGASLIGAFNDYKIKSVSIIDAEKKDDHLLALAEGIALSNYQFLNYKVNKEKEANSLQQVELVSKTLKDAAVNRLQIIVDATCKARDLVNEPVNTLDAVALSKEFQK